MDGFATMADGEHPLLVALSLALGAAEEEVAQELHLDLLEAESRAAVAAPLSGVKREGGGTHPGRQRLVLHAEEFPDRVKNAQVDGRRGARCACEGRLVHHHHVGEIISSLDRAAASRSLTLLGGCRGEIPVEDIADKGALSRAGDSADAAEDAERELHVELLDVVVADPLDLDPLLRLSALLGDVDRLVSSQVGGGEGFLGGGELGERSREHQAAALLTTSRTEVDDVVGGADHGLFVLDDDEGVPLVAQGLHDLEQLADIALMEPYARFVHDEERVDQGSSEAGGQVDTLDFSA